MALGVFAWLFHLYPPQKIYNALKYMNIPLFCAVAVGYVILMFLLDTFSISRILTRFGHPGTLRERLPARGFTYLPMVVNYAAGQAAFAFHEYRRHGVPISRMLGIFGFIVVADLFLLAALAFIATFFTTWPFDVAGMNIAQFVRLFTVATLAGIVAVIAIVRKGTELSFLARLRKNRLLALIAATRPSDYLGVVLLRLPVHLFIMGGMYVALLTFGAHIPFIKILANIPLIFFIGSLPITPGGMGTSNAALVELLKPFVVSRAVAGGSVSAGDLLFSFSLAWMFANYAMKAIIGTVCLRFVSCDLFRPTPETSEKEAEDEAVHIGGNI